MSTTAHEWHVPPEVLDRFATDPRALTDSVAASAEAHLLRCDSCRRSLSAHTSIGLVAASWAEVADRIDAPRPSPLERVLGRAGVDTGIVRLTTATRGLQVTWLASALLLAAAAAFAGNDRDATALLMALAPVLPVVGVAAAFAPGAEPGGEAVAATPIAGLGLVLRRSVVVVATAIAALLVASLVDGQLALGEVAWLGPALALSALTLAGATFRPVEIVAPALVVAWLGVIYAVHALDSTTPLPDTALFSAAGEGIAFALAAAAAAICTQRRDQLARLGGFA